MIDSFGAVGCPSWGVSVVDPDGVGLLEVRDHRIKVAVVVENGEIVWMNDQLADHTPELLRLFSDAAAEVIVGFMEHPDVNDGESARVDFSHEDRHYAVICSPMPDDPTRRTAAALISDVTDLKRTELLVEEIDQAGGDLLDLDPDTINPLDVGARLRLVEER